MKISCDMQNIDLSHNIKNECDHFGAIFILHINDFLLLYFQNIFQPNISFLKIFFELIVYLNFFSS